MTPRPISQSGAHLTEEQFGELLSASGNTAAAAHLDACPQCTAEFVQLRDSLSLFRQATTSYAVDQIRPMTFPARPFAPASERVWWTAAAALVLAALLPMQALRHHTRSNTPSSVSTATVQNDTTDEDQALLEDISTVTAASVPTSMQALADPISTNPTSTSTQRKD